MYFIPLPYPWSSSSYPFLHLTHIHLFYPSPFHMSFYHLRPPSLISSTTFFSTLLHPHVPFYPPQSLYIWTLNMITSTTYILTVTLLSQTHFSLSYITIHWTIPSNMLLLTFQVTGIFLTLCVCICVKTTELLWTGLQLIILHLSLNCFYVHFCYGYNFICTNYTPLVYFSSYLCQNFSFFSLSSLWYSHHSLWHLTTNQINCIFSCNTEIFLISQ